MKRFITTVLMLSVGIMLFAITISELLPSLSEESIGRLTSGETLERMTSNGESIRDIAPPGSQGFNLARECDSMESGFAVAGVSFIPYPARFIAMSDAERSLTVYNLIRSVSTQKGITYISHMSGDKPTVLFEDSYIVVDPEDRNSRMADPVSIRIPEIYSCYAYQKDNRFGKNIYRINYTNKENDYLMDITNYTAMKYMGFKCVEKGALHMYLEVIECDEGFVLFTLAKVADREPQVKVLFLTVDLPSAFSRRTTALKQWFEARVKEV